MAYKVAFLGFSDFERSALSSYFRLAHNRVPQYLQVATLTDADVLVADADHLPSVQLLLATERCDETVFIGAVAPAGSTAWMARPIDALRVMRELDAMVAPRPPTAAVGIGRRRPAVAADVRCSGGGACGGGCRRGDGTCGGRHGRGSSARFAGPTGMRSPVVERAAAGTRAVAPAVAAVAAAAPTDAPRVLRVHADQDPAGDLSDRLAVSWRLTIDHVGSGEAAEALLARHAYDLVLVDVDLGDDSLFDGLALCRRIKQSASSMGTSVVLLSRRPSELDRARGTFAGCDGYLACPLDDAEVHRTMRRLGFSAATQTAAAAVQSGPVDA